MKLEEYTDFLSQCLRRTIVTNQQGPLSIDDGMSAFLAMTVEMKSKDGVLYMAGNGASAAMASHMSLDATKNGKIKSKSFNDIASLTALGNDLGYDEVFAFPISQYANDNDILLTISSSGNSPSIIRAIEEAKQVGMTVITLSAMQCDNRSRSMGDLNFFIPTQTYGIAECAHQVLLHHWLDSFITHHVLSANSSVCLPVK